MFNTEVTRQLKYTLRVGHFNMTEYGAVIALNLMGYSASSRRVTDLENKYGKADIRKAAGDIRFELSDMEVIDAIENRVVHTSGAAVAGAVESTRKLTRDLVVLSGLSVQDVSDSLAISEGWNQWYADRLARTEMHQSYERAINQEYVRSGVKFHEWITVGDRRVRPAHVGNEGDGPVEIGKPFSSGQLHPGDGAQSINCRCTVQPDLSDPKLLLQPWDGGGGSLAISPIGDGTPKPPGKIKIPKVTKVVPKPKPKPKVTPSEKLAAQRAELEAAKARTAAAKAELEAVKKRTAALDKKLAEIDQTDLIKLRNTLIKEGKDVTAVNSAIEANRAKSLARKPKDFTGTTKTVDQIALEVKKQRAAMSALRKSGKVTGRANVDKLDDLLAEQQHIKRVAARAARAQEKAEKAAAGLKNGAQVRAEVDAAAKKHTAFMETNAAAQKEIRDEVQALYKTYADKRAGWGLTPEGQALSKEVSKGLTDLSKLRRSALAEHEKLVKSLIDVPAKRKVGLKVTFKDEFAQKASLEKGIARFESMVDKSVLRRIDVNIERPLPGGRGGVGRVASNYSNPTKSVRIAGNDGSVTMVHELGHHLEYNSKDALRKVTALYKRRTAGVERKWLGRGYDKDELFRPTKKGQKAWMDKYMGKVYGEPGPINATELVSMGVENMMVDAAAFARKDPELFELIIDIMRGT